MPLGQRPHLLQRGVIDDSAILSDASEERVAGPAEGSVSPTGVLLSWTALLPLQDPLQRIIYDPPTLVELGYEPI